MLMGAQCFGAKLGAAVPSDFDVRYFMISGTWSLLLLPPLSPVFALSLRCHQVNLVALWATGMLLQVVMSAQGGV